MTKEECGCEGEHHHHHHQISTDDIAKHNHLVLNAIVKVLIDKSNSMQLYDTESIKDELNNLKMPVEIRELEMGDYIKCKRLPRCAGEAFFPDLRILTVE